MAGIDEEEGKGPTPKEIGSCEWFLGHTVKNDMTVISFWWGAIRGIEQNKRFFWGGPSQVRLIF